VKALPSTSAAAWSDRALRLAGRFLRGLRDHSAFEAAASIAFWFFLSLMPLLVLVGFLIGQVARSRGVDALLGPLLEVVPGTAEALVRTELERLESGSTSIAPLGVIGFLWTASSGLHNLMDVFEIAVKAARRSWLKQRAIALGWVALGLAAACLLAWLLVTVDSALHEHDPGASASASASSATVPTPSQAAWPRSGERGTGRGSSTVARGRGALKHRVHKALQTPAEQIVAGTLLLAAGTTLLAGFYRVAVEHPPGVRRRVWPGAAAAVVSWLFVSWGFEAYALSIADYALYYGSLTAVAVLLVWLYLTSLSLVLGAEVNAQLEGIRR
jgi:membrane protein